MHVSFCSFTHAIVLYKFFLGRKKGGKGVVPAQQRCQSSQFSCWLVTLHNRTSASLTIYPPNICSLPNKNSIKPILRPGTSGACIDTPMNLNQDGLCSIFNRIKFIQMVFQYNLLLNDVGPDTPGISSWKKLPFFHQACQAEPSPDPGRSCFCPFSNHDPGRHRTTDHSMHRQKLCPLECSLLFIQRGPDLVVVLVVQALLVLVVLVCWRKDGSRVFELTNIQAFLIQLHCTLQKLSPETV